MKRLHETYKDSAYGAIVFIAIALGAALVDSLAIAWAASVVAGVFVGIRIFGAMMTSTARAAQKEDK